MSNLLGNLLLRCSTSCIHAVVRGRDSGPKYPDSSLHSYHYAPHKKVTGRLDARKVGTQVPRAESPSQNHAIFDFVTTIARHCRLLLLATIALSPADS